jgi:CRISPR-associated endonuclease/helicase Cas3
LSELVRLGRVPLITEGTTKGFRWLLNPEAPIKLPPLRLDYAQGAALYAAARLLWQQMGKRSEAAQNALIQLVGVLPTELQTHLEAIIRDERPDGARPEKSRILDTLSIGWLSRRVVAVRYKPPRSNAFNCQFAPYLLEPSGIGHTVYFMGQSDPPNALRTYRLERFENARLSDEPFEIPADFDGGERLSRAWGVMYGDGDLDHVKLRFSKFVAGRVRETLWHNSQRLTDTPEGLVWEADIGDVREIRPWIRGWGADCEVLEPQALREEMIIEARRLGRLYQSSPSSTPPTEADPALLNALFGNEGDGDQ